MVSILRAAGLKSICSVFYYSCSSSSGQYFTCCGFEVDLFCVFSYSCSDCGQYFMCCCLKLICSVFSLTLVVVVVSILCAAV